MIEIMDYVVFGAWSLLCVAFGNWLRYRKDIYRSPMPDLFISRPEEEDTYEHRK